jgi:hypothetical protein
MNKPQIGCSFDIDLHRQVYSGMEKERSQAACMVMIKKKVHIPQD